ncbi:hypothetical protein MKZ38_004271 [Zalerion maritima]|uniref:Uncharacterized protein n=1 Tax=Zalerion maritima TaxID=339359 RepID=A0AAD5WWY3_9PEZI|nr:hypothetical protein MKZ38_004271 [Zalerion maritima]
MDLRSFLDSSLFIRALHDEDLSLYGAAMVVATDIWEAAPRKWPGWATVGGDWMMDEEEEEEEEESVVTNDDARWVTPPWLLGGMVITKE